MKIVMISGASGVGKSTLSREMIRNMDIPYFIGTDIIREVANASNCGKKIASSYKAGQDKDYVLFDEEIQKNRVLSGFIDSCRPISECIDNLIKRMIMENKSIVIEGVHLIPDQIRKLNSYMNYREVIEEYFIYISNPHVHRNRFNARERESPMRKAEKYHNYFREIRWIHDFLVSLNEPIYDIVKIDNLNPIGIIQPSITIQCP